jgi:hypothetical protein
MTDRKTYRGRRVLVVDSARFTAEMARHNATTDAEIARLLETERTTITRIREGETLPSNTFFAACSDAGVDFLSFLNVERRNTVDRAA